MIAAAVPAVAPATPSRGLTTALWVVQGLLALAFLGAGFTKVSLPIDQLATQMSWVSHVPAALVRFIAVAELLGAVGLILPAATRILPVLTPLAAAGLALVMALGAATHASIGELAMVVPNFVLLGLAAFVAWGRFKKAPIAPR